MGRLLEKFGLTKSSALSGDQFDFEFPDPPVRG